MIVIYILLKTKSIWWSIINLQRIECEILDMLANTSQGICEFFRLSALNFGVAHVSFSLYPDGFLAWVHCQFGSTDFLLDNLHINTMNCQREEEVGLELCLFSQDMFLWLSNKGTHWPDCYSSELREDEKCLPTKKLKLIKKGYTIL